MSFAELGLSPKVLAAVEASGYTTPTPIQEHAIPSVLQRRDVLGIAQTGTGKTASFTLPMLTMLEHGRARARMPRTLVLEPTRELAAQVEQSFDRYGCNHKLNVALLIGGVSFGDQDAKLTRGVDVLIATPGRLLDHHERGRLLLSGIEILVIDEADRMLDMGFIPDIERICKLIPSKHQTLFFSATMPPEITRLADAFLRDPVRVEVSRPATTVDAITQLLVGCGKEAPDKRDTLRRLIRAADPFKNAIIFCNRKRDVAVLHRSLVKHGFSAAALHGDMDQYARMAALESFRTGEVKLLVASDVAARGLDIPDVSHIFNYDAPIHAEDYVHRIGRTGRAGRTGTAFTLVTSADAKYLQAIEKLIGKPIPWAEGKEARNAPPAEARESGRGRSAESREGGPREGGRRRSGERKASAQPPREDGARPDRGRRPPEQAEPAARKPAAQKAPAARPQAPRPAPAFTATKPAPAERRQRNEPREEVVIGLGDHVPSFLLRPVRIGRS